MVRTDLQEQISELEHRLREEEEKRTEAEGKLEQRLKEEEESRVEMRNELEQKLREEQEKRTEVENELEQRLKEEQEKRREREQQMEQRMSGELVMKIKVISHVKEGQRNLGQCGVLLQRKSFTFMASPYRFRTAYSGSEFYDRSD